MAASISLTASVIPKRSEAGHQAAEQEAVEAREVRQLRGPRVPKTAEESRKGRLLEIHDASLPGPLGGAMAVRWRVGDTGAE